MASIPNRTPNILAASGAVVPGFLNHITLGSAAALTLAAPTVDGQEAVFIDETGHAHTVTTPATLINGVDHIATFGGTAGSSIYLVSRNGVWWAIALNGVTLS